jgi:type VI secretion system protein ImpA
MTSGAETARTAATAPPSELAPLLEPIAGERPAGESLRYDGTYDALREARREEDPALPQGVWKRDLKKADWKEVVRVAGEALASRSKDLQIAVWLAEAWVRLDGLPGAARGFQLLAALCERFWPLLLPPIEDGDLEGRLAPLEWLNHSGIDGLKRLAVTDGGAREGGDYAWFDWEAALHTAQAPATGKGDAGESGGPPTRSSILARVSVTPTPFYRRWEDDLTAASAALEELVAALREVCGEQAPSLGQIRETLVEMSNFVRRVIESRREETMEIDDAAAAGGEGGGEQERSAEGEGAPPARSGGVISSRAEAYRMLSQAADFLVRTEPHSPAPYLVRRAISWGSLSLADLLKELLQQKADLATVYQLLGIGPGQS